MSFDLMQFKYPWRSYQQRVLDELDAHLDDQHLHVVAAPGSGKTILGLEVMRRLGEAALILAPSIAIRNQWAARLTGMFLPEGAKKPDWISTDIRNPKLVTIITYQALHAAFSGGREETEDALDEEEAEEDDSENGQTKTSEKAKTIKTLAKAGVKAMVLDEAHHLRREWWKALDELKSELGQKHADLSIVALTATPPYDVEGIEWTRYHQMCGPIDAEISVPELVRENNLCPHQDYIWFSYPTAAEKQTIRNFKQDVADFIEALLEDDAFTAALEAHPFITAPLNHAEAILDAPEFFSAMLIFLNRQGVAPSKDALELMGAKPRDIPALNFEWAERLLNNMLYPHAEEFFPDHEELILRLRRDLKRIGALEKRVVSLKENKQLKKLLSASLSKLDSIADIARFESAALDGALRMVVLCDFIRKDQMPKSADDIAPLSLLGVVPVFEKLRRENLAGVKLGVLTGSLVIIPAASLDLLQSIADENGVARADISARALPHDDDFVQISVSGKNRQKIVHLVTELFGRGGVNILAGTQALLGEGWDAPSINTLVLASYVGSYMLSNQMRGRAIRIDPNAPDKASNIWHLVAVDAETWEEKLRYMQTGETARQQCFDPMDDIKKDLGPDLAMMKRRSRAFEGLSFDAPLRIENGLSRFALGKVSWTENGLRDVNDGMKAFAQDRAALARNWDEALMTGSPHPHMEEAVQSVYAPQMLSMLNTIKGLLLEAALLFLMYFIYTLSNSGVIFIAVALAALAAAPRALKAGYLWLRNGSLEGSLKQVGYCVLETLQHMGAIKTRPDKLKVTAALDSGGVAYCRLEGATTYERTRFLEALGQVLGPVDNPRYVVVRRTWVLGLKRVDYHPVPDVIGRNKENAVFFLRRWRRYVSDAKLIFTRNPEGRKALLQARSKSMAASFRKKTEIRNKWQ